MAATDQMLARYVAEIEDRQRLIDSIVESAGDGDISDEKLAIVTDANKRIQELNERMKPFEEARRISGDSAARIEQLARFMSQTPTVQDVEYRSAGGYVLDVWKAGLGDQEAEGRLEIYHRAAAHQKTTDNPGLLPETILGPVVNFIDAARPTVSVLGPRQIPGYNWARPKVTQHTSVAAQGGEKTELVSQKMTIGKLTVTPTTYGGYVNLSRQDVDFTQPQIMDLVINDLAAQYAIQTEAALTAALIAGGTAGPTLPATPTAANVSSVLWTAVASVYTATKGQGRVVAVVSPDVLGSLGQLFFPVNPFNAISPGFNASDFGQGVMGTISGIPIIASTSLPAKSFLVLSSAAAEVYEDRIGSLQVVEPSVLGIQVAYAGYFASLLIEATGIIKVTVT